MDKPIEITNAKDWNPTDSDYYHIQIHFKRNVKGFRGSIEFDQKKDRISSMWKIESKNIGCRSGKEWLKINGLLLLVPLIGSIASYLDSKFLLNWSDKDVWGMVLPVIGIGFGLGTILKREL